MKRYITVDSGKSFTKVDIYDEPSNQIISKNIRTKYDEGIFEDTDPGQNTSLIEFDGQIYRVGQGATKEAELKSSKKLPIHKICTMLAVALECSADEVDEVYCGIGIPVKDYEFPEERNSYRDYILPTEPVTVRFKRTGESPIETRTFRFVGRYVYPEGCGALVLPGVMGMGTVALIDIGHLNVNGTIYNGGDADLTMSFTTTKGCNALVSGLAQKLSAAYSFINKAQTAEVLGRTGKDRCLKPIRSNPQIEESSKTMIDKYLIDYVTALREDCLAAQWSVDYTQFVFIGGTTAIIANEIKEVFGDEVIISEYGAFTNAMGMLALMCGRPDVLGKKIM